MFAVCNIWRNTAKNSFAVYVHQKQHGKDINIVATTNTHSKNMEHGTHPERHTTKNWTRQRNKIEHDKVKKHDKEVDAWPVARKWRNRYGGK
jgi:hypothetical protein